MPLSKKPQKNADSKADGRQNPVTVSTSENLPEEQTQENVSPSSIVATGAGVELGIPTIDLSETPPRALGFGRQNGNDEIFQIIDLSQTPPDDDVILVSEINDIVDIRTPVRLQRRSNSISTVSGQEQINSSTAQASNNNVQRATRRRRSVDDKSSIGKFSSLHVPRSPFSVTGEKLDSPARFACPICLESTVNQPTSTRCGHVYCQSCIREAVKFNRLCPMCNAPVAPRELRRIYFIYTLSAILVLADSSECKKSSDVEGIRYKLRCVHYPQQVEVSSEYGHNRTIVSSVPVELAQNVLKFPDARKSPDIIYVRMRMIRATSHRTQVNRLQGEKTFNVEAVASPVTVIKKTQISAFSRERKLNFHIQLILFDGVRMICNFNGSESNGRLPKGLKGKEVILWVQTNLYLKLIDLESLESRFLTSTPCCRIAAKAFISNLNDILDKYLRNVKQTPSASARRLCGDIVGSNVDLKSGAARRAKFAKRAASKNDYREAGASSPDGRMMDFPESTRYLVSLLSNLIFPNNKI
ncbi:hypothetical protein GQX74_009032 [Glossina fuscipes]|nr:hypothetical protein GQX74_009032 [Glossina fuscipes]